MDIINEKTVDMTFDEFCRGGKSITPGPWHFVIEDGERKIAAPPKSKDYKREILMCDEPYYPYCPDEDADWRLIAAAPDMLDALKNLLWYVGQLEMLVYSADDAGEHEEVAKARAAIAKAEEKNTCK
jgi:hypothetical protein